MCHYLIYTEAAAPRCSVKKLFLEISQKSQENTCPRVSLLIKFQASGLYYSLVLYLHDIPCGYITLHVFTYLKVYVRLEVIVWRNIRLFSWRGKIWLFYIAVGYSFVFCFRLNVFTSKIWICCYLSRTRRGERGWVPWILKYPSSVLFFLSQNLWRNHVKVIPYL